jgi:hypothetical protein
LKDDFELEKREKIERTKTTTKMNLHYVNMTSQRWTIAMCLADRPLRVTILMCLVDRPLEDY